MILVGVFAAPSLGGAGFGDGNNGSADQVTVQVISVVATIAYTAVVSFILLKIIDVIVGLRVTTEQETEGLDQALHDERGYIL